MQMLMMMMIHHQVKFILAFINSIQTRASQSVRLSIVPTCTG